jgi:uncharacterized membrane protein YphA (DoxX/SURF4 family)
MDYIIIICQLIIALGIFNVWLLRFGRPTRWRGGRAQSMKEEFAAYGLPVWFMRLIGVLKLTLAFSLLLGIWIPVLTKPAAMGMAILMLGAISMHFKVKDPSKKSLPAFSLLTLSVVVAIF